MSKALFYYNTQTVIMQYKYYKKMLPNPANCTKGCIYY